MVITRDLKIMLAESLMQRAAEEHEKLFYWARIEALKRNGAKAMAIKRVAAKLEKRKMGWSA